MHVCFLCSDVKHNKCVKMITQNQIRMHNVEEERHIFIPGRAASTEHWAVTTTIEPKFGLFGIHQLHAGIMAWWTFGICVYVSTKPTSKPNPNKKRGTNLKIYIFWNWNWNVDDDDRRKCFFISSLHIQSLSIRLLPFFVCI